VIRGAFPRQGARRRAAPPPRDGRAGGRRAGSVEAMDISSMIMGASIASVAWVGCYPWAKLRKLRAMEAAEAAREGEAPVG
jgi:hypothetical protein